MLPRNKSQEFFDDPSKLTKYFRGIRKVKKCKIFTKSTTKNLYNIEMIPKDSKENIYKLQGGEKDINRLCLLFGYNKLKKDEIENMKKDLVPTPLSKLPQYIK